MVGESAADACLVSLIQAPAHPVTSAAHRLIGETLSVEKYRGPASGD